MVPFVYLGFQFSVLLYHLYIKGFGIYVISLTFLVPLLARLRTQQWKKIKYTQDNWISECSMFKYLEKVGMMERNGWACSGAKSPLNKVGQVFGLEQ